jgi:hypothetical protein
VAIVNPVTGLVTAIGAGTCNIIFTINGGCNGTPSAQQALVVSPNNTISLTSAAGTDNQSVCVFSPITNITYATTGATGATFNGLPTGVNGNWVANVVTISGTPTVSGTFTYTVTLTGGCAVVTASGTITVNPLPVPTISGPASACINSTGNVYTTQTGSGIHNYIWSVTGGIITAGGTATDNTVTVTWTTLGVQTVSVNYTDINGCTAAAPTIYNVTVNPLPVPTLAGPNPVCVNSTGNVYNTEAGMTNYVWTVSAGGQVTGGGGSTSSSVTVTWNTTGAQWVAVNYTNGNGCTALAATIYNVTVNPRPVPTITGPNPVCAQSTVNYTTESGMTGYIWTVTAGGTINGAATNSSVSITWNTVGAQTLTVNYNNLSGCPAITPTSYGVTVNALPVPTITGPTNICIGTAGNDSHTV